uniref:Glycerate kinase n=1 Tax=Favella ehrenbergii TaxID=182087 RepID=A0A7S3I6R1_9SPIT|mmetsp:Transcript_36424/g.44529  ORF Transcript_36424/g.44529 Transcript_36424/m.44529 type:complete len:136 (+) Transcript_36424:897-1304(+)
MERTSLVSGLDFVADLTDLQQKVSGSDLVVTGEGSFDLQTLQGKAVAQIIDICLQKDKHVVVLCGVNQVTQQDLSGKYSDDQLKKIKVYDLVSRYGAEGSMKRTKECLELLCSTEIKALFTSSGDGDGDGASQSE